MTYAKSDKETKKLGKFIALKESYEMPHTSNANNEEELSTYILLCLMLARIRAMNRYKKVWGQKKAI